ncbi:MAG TPA: hypothetical protein PKM57_11885 [Kiritimatiellia bacterium]|nr:hypothetical protein [Kiritimatiellia bacterium]HPS06240.1 hypothetical protein [Kiritimatiellia bacterium]
MQKQGRCVSGRAWFGWVALSLGILSGCRSNDDLPRFVCRWGHVQSLTAGPGNDTEAVWSPDGKRIAFQTDRKGDLDVMVLDVASGHLAAAADGAGHACYPAWTPDGALVYAFGKLGGTAVQSANTDCGYGLRLLQTTGETRLLTQGHWRDYTPSVAADGKTVYYASTRDCTGNSASLWRLTLAPAVSTACVLHLDGGTVGAVQPSLSPDGSKLVWAQLDSFRQNWRLCAAFSTNLDSSVFLTPSEMSAYAPRWSPDGRFIAFTGFRQGDPGWGACVLEPYSGRVLRLDTGKGNTRNPCWSPSGKEIVFENNRTGCYKLYRMPVTCCAAPMPFPPEATPGAGQIEARLQVLENRAVLIGANGSTVVGKRSAPNGWMFDGPKGLDFGADAFFVRVTLVVDAHEQGTHIAAVGNYAENALGWQVYVRDNRKLWFNSRDPKGQFVGVESDQPVETGKPVTVLGIRDADGTVRMFLNGKLQSARNSGATMSYGPALKVSLGQQWNGGMRFNGRVLGFECGRGYPKGVPCVPTREALFKEVVK